MDTVEPGVVQESGVCVRSGEIVREDKILKISLVPLCLNKRIHQAHDSTGIALSAKLEQNFFSGVECIADTLKELCMIPNPVQRCVGEDHIIFPLKHYGTHIHKPEIDGRAAPTRLRRLPRRLRRCMLCRMPSNSGSKRLHRDRLRCDASRGTLVDGGYGDFLGGE